MISQVYKDIFVGDDAGFEKVRGDNDWAIVRACKEGSGGHRDTLGYKTQGAPKNSQYLSVKKNNVLALNLIDADNPDYIPDDLIEEALKFIKDELAKDKKILIACNGGISRSPSIALLYLYA